MNKLEGLPTIHYISLEESVDRRTNLENWFQKYNITNYVPHLFQRFEEYKHELTGPYVDLLETEGKGAITSHFSVLREWYETTDESYTLIVEDDLSLETVEYWNFAWKEFYENLPKDWSCIQLILIREYFCEDYCLETRQERDWCAGAYLIKREYVKLLLDLYYFNNTFNLNIENLNYPPVIELLLFYNNPRVYCFPLFVEDINRTQSTFKDINKLQNGQGPNHHSSYNNVINWWKNKGKYLKIQDIMNNTPFTYINLKSKYNMNIKGIIHVGAHYGEEVNDYIDSGVNDIVLFEPLQDNFRILSERIKGLQSNITLHQVALGSIESKTLMYVSDNEKQSSSILKPKVHLSHHPDVYFPDIEEVDVKLLDNYKYKKYNYLHMDVQGYELEVLKGATETLNHIDYVYCEVNRDELYEGNAYVEQIDEFLSKYNMNRVETYWMGDLWGDALYVKQPQSSDYKLCLSEVNFNTNYSPIFIDVGCNINDNLDDFTELFFSLYPKSRCIAIEPLFYENYEKKWKEDSRVNLVKSALDDKIGIKPIYTPSIWSECDSGLSSLYKRKIFNEKYRTSLINCITLDQLCDDLNIDYIDYLKIDTEGSELSVLKGSVNLLQQKKIDYIQLEYGGCYEDAGYTILDIENHLKKYKYNLIYKTENYDNAMRKCGELLFKFTED